MAVEMAVERWHRDGVREVRASPIDVLSSSRVKSTESRVKSKVEELKRRNRESSRDME